MEVMKIFDSKFHEIIKDDVKSVLLDNPEVSKEPTSKCDNTPQSLPISPEKTSEKTKFLSCNYCKIQFDDVQQQRDHYKLDWHRYNLKKSLQSKNAIEEIDFNNKSLNDDLSSISGSDTETDNDSTDNLDSFATAQGKIFLQNSTGQVFSMYNCLIRDKKDCYEQVQLVLLERLRERCVKNQTWTVLMLGGGHFAGSVFRKDKPILHKTFHCYTVRAGQGGSQSSKDNQKGGAIKSAGASLRRYNEQALVQHVRGIIDAWKSEIDESSLIIYRASGPHNRSVLFGSFDGTSALDKNDPRLVTIPFSTRRATFKEVERVHGILSSIFVYRDFQSAVDHFTREKQPESGGKRGKIRINRAKSREVVERPLPVVPLTSENSDSSDDCYELSSGVLEVDLNESLQEFNDSLTSEERTRPRKTRKKKPKKSQTKKLKEREELRKNDLINTIVTGDLDKLKTLLLQSPSEKTDDDGNFIAALDEVLDSDGNNLLHLACLKEQEVILKYLLENDANPCLRNAKQQTPYTCTQSKEIRETLKTFARENPNKFNYNKAQIPLKCLDPEESAEKKKMLRKIKKDKEKIKKQDEKLKRIENEEKLRFLNLSDREKRALAAERRLLDQSGSVISRCFLCAADISGQVPFEYLTNRFCSVDCLKSHRIQNLSVS